MVSHSLSCWCHGTRLPHCLLSALPSYHCLEETRSVTGKPRITGLKSGRYVEHQVVNIIWEFLMWLVCSGFFRLVYNVSFHVLDSSHGNLSAPLIVLRCNYSGNLLHYPPGKETCAFSGTSSDVYSAQLAVTVVQPKTIKTRVFTSW